MLEIELSGGAKYTTQNAATIQTSCIYDGYYAVALTGGFRPKYSDQSKKVRFSAILIACNENGEINDDFAQVLELGSNLSKVIYTRDFLTLKSSADFVKKWQFDKSFGDCPVFFCGMIVKITNIEKYGFEKPYGFDARKEFEQNNNGDYKIREDMKRLHSIFTFHNVGKTASWAIANKGEKLVDGFSDANVKAKIEKHINYFFEQQVDFATSQNKEQQ